MTKKKLVTSAKLYKMLKDCAKPAENVTTVHNRNPRNLEMMKIAYRPTGFYLDAPGRCFWHR